MAKSVTLLIISLMLSTVSWYAVAETRAEQNARCQVKRQACIDDNQHQVRTNAQGVKYMPVEVVQQCANVFKDCMGIPR